MAQQHPITPPPDLVQQWIDDNRDRPGQAPWIRGIATDAARWGADQELEACRMEIIDGVGRTYFDETRHRVLMAENIWAARRPKPPSLKEQAMQALCRFMASEGHEDCTEEEVEGDFNTIRQALEQLPDAQ